MPSWVRYSVSVYLGLLLAGSLVPTPTASVGSQVERPRSLEPPELIEFMERLELAGEACEPACDGPAR